MVLRGFAGGRTPSPPRSTCPGTGKRRRADRCTSLDTLPNRATPPRRQGRRSTWPGTGKQDGRQRPRRQDQPVLGQVNHTAPTDARHLLDRIVPTTTSGRRARVSWPAQSMSPTQPSVATLTLLSSSVVSTSTRTFATIRRVLKRCATAFARFVASVTPLGSRARPRITSVTPEVNFRISSAMRSSKSFACVGSSAEPGSNEMRGTGGLGQPSRSGLGRKQSSGNSSEHLSSATGGVAAGCDVGARCDVAGAGLAALDSGAGTGAQATTKSVRTSGWERQLQESPGARPIPLLTPRAKEKTPPPSLA